MVVMAVVLSVKAQVTKVVGTIARSKVLVHTTLEGKEREGGAERGKGRGEGDRTREKRETFLKNAPIVSYRGERLNFSHVRQNGRGRQDRARGEGSHHSDVHGCCGEEGNASDRKVGRRPGRMRIREGGYPVWDY